jgi:hypothetical protein
VGDGVVDDTAAVQAYIKRAAECRRTALFPPGMYFVRQTIDVPDGSTIMGANIKSDMPESQPVFRWGNAP